MPSQSQSNAATSRISTTTTTTTTATGTPGYSSAGTMSAGSTSNNPGYTLQPMMVYTPAGRDTATMSPISPNCACTDPKWCMKECEAGKNAAQEAHWNSTHSSAAARMERRP
ncbi:hypothetical protein CI109_101304 [Kwoniella shandongensis]|uniref:Uncharacterized protein n=1 Tax=Kwoniella shandongensis TaxID=1734106 RepID=A0AAJ8MVG7_9TREE